MTLTRRETIGTLALVGLAGCSGSEPTEGDEPSDSGADDGPEPTDVFELVEHEFARDVAGPQLIVTVRNKSDDEIGLVNVSCNVYEDDTRLANSSMNISDLGSGIQAETEMTFLDTNAQDLQAATRYEIIISASLSAGEVIELTEEFDNSVTFQSDA